MTMHSIHPGPVVEGERLVKRRWVREFTMLRQQLATQARRFGRPVRVVAVSPSSWMLSRVRALAAVGLLLAPEEPPLGVAAEHVDMAILHGQLDGWNRRVVLRQAHRSLILGGRMVVVREFTHREDEDDASYSFSQFLEELQLATGNGVVIETLESYPIDRSPIHRAALAAFTRVGISQTW